MSVGTPIVAIRSLALTFSLGFEFFRTKSRQGCWSFPDILRIVLQQLGTHRSIFIKRSIAPLLNSFPKGLQALVGLLVRCFFSLHALIVRSRAFSSAYHYVRSVYGDTTKDCRCAVRFSLVLIDIE